MDGATAAAVAVIAAATVGGAWFAATLRDSPGAALRLAASALVGVVALDLVPDVLAEVAEAESARWLVGAACGAGFAAATVASLWVCACGTHPATATGLAVALHRAVEGAAVAIVASAGVVSALVLHAAAEGFALGTLGSRRLVLLTCVSPAVGAALLGGVELPGSVAPVVTAVVAGALVASSARLLAVAGQPALAGRAT